MLRYEPYIYRCLELALLGAGTTAPNPMVGAVLVHDQTIIGEGFTQPYGGAHAEAECIRGVDPEHKRLIPESTLYVSLEPCAHYGKTPPCTDLILQQGIKKVVIGCGDPFAKVNGKGIAQLRAGGVDVIVGVLEADCKAINRRFFTFHQQQRPYILLKWAQSADGMMAGEGGKPVAISSPATNRLVHGWRSREAAIFVGRQTAINDNPQLTTRYWPGKNPVRIVADSNLLLPETLHLFDGTVPTIVINSIKELPGTTARVMVTKGPQYLQTVMRKLAEASLISVLVEGGAQLLNAFIREGLWDEARIITNGRMTIPNGLPAPKLTGGALYTRKHWQTDSIDYYYNTAQYNFFQSLTFPAS